MTPALSILAYFMAINIVTLLLFWWDKRCATLYKRRIPERSLLLCVALGGAFGAWRAMKRYHHKVHNKSFRRKIWIIVVLQLLSIGILTYLGMYPDFIANLPETLRLTGLPS
jgi:uncharacterized membrane protein YsdA (DUF1294 family)